MLRVSKILSGAALALLLTAGAGKAEDNLIEFRSLTPELAVKAGQAALAACRSQGYQVAVAVLDRVAIEGDGAQKEAQSEDERAEWTAN